MSEENIKHICQNTNARGKYQKHVKALMPEKNIKKTCQSTNARIKNLK